MSKQTLNITLNKRQNVNMTLNYMAHKLQLDFIWIEYSSPIVSHQPYCVFSWEVTFYTFHLAYLLVLHSSIVINAK